MVGDTGTVGETDDHGPGDPARVWVLEAGANFMSKRLRGACCSGSTKIEGTTKIVHIKIRLVHFFFSRIG